MFMIFIFVDLNWKFLIPPPLPLPLSFFRRFIRCNPETRNK